MFFFLFWGGGEFLLANSDDPNQKPHFAASELGSALFAYP